MSGDQEPFLTELFNAVVDFFAYILDIPGAIADRVKAFISDLPSEDLDVQGNFNLFETAAGLLPREVGNALGLELAVD